MDNLILIDSLNKINESLNEISKNINNLNKDKEYDKLLKENIKQKEVIDKVIYLIIKETKSMPINGCKIRLIEILDILKEVLE